MMKLVLSILLLVQASVLGQDRLGGDDDWGLPKPAPAVQPGSEALSFLATDGNLAVEGYVQDGLALVLVAPGHIALVPSAAITLPAVVGTNPCVMHFVPTGGGGGTWMPPTKVTINGEADTLDGAVADYQKKKEAYFAAGHIIVPSSNCSGASP